MSDRADLPADLSFIQQAAAARRHMRRDLRREAKLVADELVDVLRVGDLVVVDRRDEPGPGEQSRALYGVVKVRWWSVPAEHQAVQTDWEQSPHSAPAFVRIVGSRLCALTDPRALYHDDWGRVHEPVGRDLIVEGELSDAVSSAGLATDPELMAFSLEAATVAHSFAQALTNELNTMADAVQSLRSFRRGDSA